MPDREETVVRIGDVAKELGLSASRVRQLANSGVIPSTRTEGGQRVFDLAAVRAAVGRRELAAKGRSRRPVADPDWEHELTLLGLAEHEVWRKVVKDTVLVTDTPAGKIMAYAFNEMLNNAIDHSDSERARIRWWIASDLWSFEISDDGTGAYSKLLDGLHLGSEFEAVQELSKGKRTTDPTRHTGEGIFFTSKAVDLFRLTSTGIRWTVDNLREDVALGVADAVPGTSVFCRIDPSTTRELGLVFREFTEDHGFVRTRPVVKLFEIGTEFVSRSEARRLLEGLDTDFDVVEVDFTGVSDVGQGFVDELVRVWPAAHPGKNVVPVNMAPAVEFMVRRGLPSS